MTTVGICDLTSIQKRVLVDSSRAECRCLDHEASIHVIIGTDEARTGREDDGRLPSRLGSDSGIKPARSTVQC